MFMNVNPIDEDSDNKIADGNNKNEDNKSNYYYCCAGRVFLFVEGGNL